MSLLPESALLERSIGSKPSQARQRLRLISIQTANCHWTHSYFSHILTALQKMFKIPSSSGAQFALLSYHSVLFQPLGLPTLAYRLRARRRLLYCL